VVAVAFGDISQGRDLVEKSFCVRYIIPFMNSEWKIPAPDQDDLSGLVVAVLRRITRAIDLRNRHLITRYGLTGPQLTVLRELSLHEGCSVGQLTRAIHLSQATVTGIIDRLVKRDLVRRRRSDTDKRRVEVWLTEAGKQLLIDAPPLLQEEFLDQFNELKDWEKTQILSSLQRVVSMMETKHVEPPPLLAHDPVTSVEANEFLASSSSSLSGEPPLPAESEGTIHRN
jgi:DNA-binding MarR family transcriptional regulator